MLQASCGAKGPLGARCRLERPQRHANVVKVVLYRVVGPDECGGKTEHAPVLPEYLCGKGFDALKPGSPRKLGEKQLPNPLRLPPVFYDDRHLGLTAVPAPDVHGVADDMLFCSGDGEFS